MATCDSLQPVVLLTDVMEPNESFFGTTATFQVEQTEPLNLCLNGTVFEAFTVLDCSPTSGENVSCSDQSDDDVIFVKEYKFGGAKRGHGQKGGTPRRNPVRKARVSRRFKDENEFVENSVEDEEALDVFEPCISKKEDSEDWKFESVPRRGKPRKKVIKRKVPFRLGRKRKANSAAKIDEKKVPLKELKPLFETNLLLLRDYIKDLRTVSKTQENEERDRTTNAINIFKQQVKFLTVANNSDDDLVTKIVTEL
ncbi:uncharacterized protein LOC103313250 [Tribolium castaneum]|uniref:Uncharacterized protein n=1 Tax=Tribolium castaneum TaxID=7070 RepID=D6WN34_TRICA|nr:PREDICTED: uncharacterized protein LOC103313250 [Tribolium castaneum]EFA03244.2 hypothetical protein TcasGA2_TC013176 [Tribolium castaneum]|eukprot:XP_008194292.1 PREDICTED: uncharacterized protein LOC103313250 [Tribolium castaneum]